MTRWAWTGSRLALEPDEIALVCADVARTLNDGDEVGTGGCSGVDEWVMRVTSLLKKVINIRLVTFAADAERAWPVTRAPTDVIERSDEVIGRGYMHDGTYLGRNRALVDWSDLVRAAPLDPLQRDANGRIVVPRGGGTAYTARYADQHAKLIAELALRTECKSVAHTER